MRAMVEESGPFHEGELTLQRATGERGAGASNGRIIVDRVIPAWEEDAFPIARRLARLAEDDPNLRE